MLSFSPVPALIFLPWSECNLVNWTCILSAGLQKPESCTYCPAQTLPHLPTEHGREEKLVLATSGPQTALPWGGEGISVLTMFPGFGRTE